VGASASRAGQVHSTDDTVVMIVVDVLIEESYQQPSTSRTPYRFEVVVDAADTKRVLAIRRNYASTIVVLTYILHCRHRMNLETIVLAVCLVVDCFLTRYLLPALLQHTSKVQSDRGSSSCKMLGLLIGGPEQ
jgi:hypothetical protein